MSSAHPDGPPTPPRAQRLLTLAARLLQAHDQLVVARNAIAASPVRSATVLAALHDVIDAEIAGLDGLIAGLYRLVELAEDSWDDLDGPDPVPARYAADLDASIGRAVEHALSDLGRLSGALRSLHPVHTRAVVAGWPHASAEQVYRSVADLPVDSRRMLALAESTAVGSTDGVPWPVRAMANMVRIRRLVHRAQLASVDWNPRDWRLSEMLRRVDDPATSGPRPLRRRRFYVSFSTEYSGRLIELVGTLNGRTEAIGVYVPGTGTNLDMSHVNTEVAQNFAAAADGRLAMLVFLDGEFPQHITRDATDPRFAIHLAPALRRLVDEVNQMVAQVCPGALITVLGHSYGARVVGRAEHSGMRADRVIYVEAPDLGPGISGPAQLRNPAPVQRFTLTAPADPVELLQIRAGLRRRWSISDLGDVGVRLDTGTHADGRPVFGTHGHGAVFDPDTGAFAAMLTVMIGGTTERWRDREISARHVRVRRGSDGQLVPALIRAAIGLGLRRKDDPYTNPVILWKSSPRPVQIPKSPRTSKFFTKNK